jgi:hypothetical protein
VVVESASCRRITYGSTSAEAAGLQRIAPQAPSQSVGVGGARSCWRTAQRL